MNLLENLTAAWRSAHGTPYESLLRGLIQYIKEAEGVSCSVSALPKKKVYVFSNVKYPKENKLKLEKDDIVVFLNKSIGIDYYEDHKNKIVYHRSPHESYGVEVMGCVNRYVFEAGKAAIPQEFIQELKAAYDWNYEIEDGKVKSMTTGYMVTKYMQKLYHDREIILVNFGYEVNKSTYRCPWHNWQFEAEQLKTFKHIYLEEGKDKCLI